MSVNALRDRIGPAAGGSPHAAPCPGIFLSTFNNAWQTYAERGPHAQEEIAFRVAWAAVKKHYHKRGDVWVANAW